MRHRRHRLLAPLAALVIAPLAGCYPLPLSRPGTRRRGAESGVRVFEELGDGEGA